jgi:pimeloyl-ACP methyl ester carboxylesterase
MKPLCRFVAALMLAACATAAWSKSPLNPCRIAGIRNEVQCGVVTRPLNPAQPDGVTIDVHYVVVPAMARRRLPDPVFLLAGGPGQSAITVAPQVMHVFSRLNNRRDIVFVDQRGTGRSAPLECEDPRHQPLAEQTDPERQFLQLGRCREKLQTLPHVKSADGLRYYTTTIAMQDLDAVRRQLGVERVDLVGASYGTRAALEYLRQFPAQVRRVVIDGVAPPDMVLPLSYAIDGQRVFDAVFAACEAEAACAMAHPALRSEWGTVMAGLPKKVTVAHPLSGQAETFTLTREMVLGAVRGPLYSPAIAAALPQAIAEAARGRFEPLAGMSSLFASRKGMSMAMGMHFSVVCSEDHPRMGQAPDSAASDFGRDFTRLYERVCATWPHGEVPAAFYRIPSSPVPVLIMSGGLDPVTPPRHGERVARALGANALHVVVPNAGHGVMSISCMRDVLYRFIDAEEDDEALAVDASCARNVPRPLAYQPLTLSAQDTK